MAKETRLRIIEKSFGVFLKHGYEGASLKNICYETGLTKGALYHYFSGKKELYKATVDYFFSQSALPEWIKNKPASIKELIEKVFIAVDASYHQIKKRTRISSDNAILFFYEFLYEATRLFPEYQRLIDEHDATKYQILTSYFVEAQQRGEVRSDLDPHLLSIELYALQQQMIYLRFVNPWIKTHKTILLDLAAQFLKKIEVNDVH